MHLCQLTQQGATGTCGNHSEPILYLLVRDESQEVCLCTEQGHLGEELARNSEATGINRSDGSDGVAGAGAGLSLPAWRHWQKVLTGAGAAVGAARNDPLSATTIGKGFSKV